MIKSPYSIKYKSGIYTFSVSKRPLLLEAFADLHTKECKSFIIMFKQVFRRRPAVFIVSSRGRLSLYGCPKDERRQSI